MGHGVGPVLDPKLPEELADIRLDAPHREAERRADLLVALRGRHQIQDFGFAIGQVLGAQALGEPVPDWGSDHRPAGVDRPDGSDDLPRLRVLEQAPSGAEAKASIHVFVPFIRNQEDYPRFRPSALNLHESSYAVQDRQPCIHDHDVRTRPASHRYGHATVPGLADHPQIGFAIDDGTKAFPEHGRGIGNQHPDGTARGSRAQTNLLTVLSRPAA